MAIGFTNYEEQVVVPVLTLKEKMTALSSASKIAVLNGFVAKILPGTLKHTVPIDSILIEEIYREIDRIEETSRVIMREEVVMVEATYDEFGEELTPAEYNVAPTTIDELKAELAPNFVDSFTTAQVGAIVDKMVQYSKSDGSGTAAFYATEVIK